MRKRSGTIAGEVRLNGFLQDPVSFRRCSGYVEQFDVQSPELTVRETVLFSARLRLDPALVDTDEKKQAHVDQVLEATELSSLANALVGSEESGGLSFEQKKRLSIAVELAASPSILFLDEVNISDFSTLSFITLSLTYWVSPLCSRRADWMPGVQNWWSARCDGSPMVIGPFVRQSISPAVLFSGCL